MNWLETYAAAADEDKINFIIQGGRVKAITAKKEQVCFFFGTKAPFLVASAPTLDVATETFELLTGKKVKLERKKRKGVITYRPREE